MDDRTNSSGKMRSAAPGSGLDEAAAPPVSEQLPKSADAIRTLLPWMVPFVLGSLTVFSCGASVGIGAIFMLMFVAVLADRALRRVLTRRFGTKQ